MIASISCNPDTLVQKVKIIICPEVRIESCCQGFMHIILDMVDAAAQTGSVADKGHKHSSGQSEVCFFLSGKGLSLVSKMAFRGTAWNADASTFLPEKPIESDLTVAPESSMPSGDWRSLPFSSGWSRIYARLQDENDIDDMGEVEEKFEEPYFFAEQVGDTGSPTPGSMTSPKKVSFGTATVLPEAMVGLAWDKIEPIAKEYIAAWKADEDTPMILQVAAQDQIVEHLHDRLNKKFVHIYDELSSEDGVEVIQRRLVEMISHEVYHLSP